MIDYGELFYEHYTKFLGEPKKRKTFRKSNEIPSIQILRYENVFEGCTVFTSLGLSRYESILGTISEVTLVTDCAFDESDEILANILFHCIDQKIKIGRGMSIAGIANINKEFSKMYQKNALYFTIPYGFPDDYGSVKILGQINKGVVYQSFFISQKEHEFFVANGAEAFEDILEEKEVDPFELNRKSII
ncbi:suppressor of fused domain protein [Clostridium estertheticum]|uniref:suppressor of fused domain protein n=1 Tax=Clostridium estertheticum TaxID=238834 RepID=UPI001CF5AF7E|nr:suppressor of fused domain protein [Clostridium estertheticum]MCB2309240.1 suppressor of fused domain protein [Clostridium estertheticum]MCB2347629.1 suppressor of fused domain protein [Clostridium estertheticum]MCB2352195.1 suppressor of fused domain protein [Clostridium estertheticum]WAG45290.1 suppressor of fused domain protein [Clostridium estertheticum]